MADALADRMLDVAFGAARALARRVPAGLRRRAEDRFFRAVGHVTRVTNDGYPQPAELIPAGGPPDPDGARRR